jgi:S1-C subfamily serine protease
MLLRQRAIAVYRRFHDVLFIGAGILITLVVVLIYNAVQPPPQRLTQRDIDGAVVRALSTMPPAPSFESQAYLKVQSAVVLLKVISQEADGEHSGEGSGFIISKDGTILTCLHVVHNAVSIEVTFADGSKSTASVSAKDEVNDLAVVRPHVIPDDIKPAIMAGANSLHVGDEVVAVGNPFGIPGSLSSGVVSGLKRSFISPGTDRTLTNLIQFDAAVNPGNSGGPLVDRDGEVVGIVVALLNPTEENVFIGIGFATTIETAGRGAGLPGV